MKAADIRNVFIDFFKDKGHKIVDSSPLIPKDDPTLLFTSAGMVQFKEYFQAGDVSRLSFTRAASCQKCLRAGGKKSDLENVGKTARHHSFFEMLGNFSFGDYFKEEAISYAWEFVSKVMQINTNRVWATVHHDDEEARRLWLQYLPDERIVSLGDNDNFWGPAGETGPCGPSSELYYDYGAEIGCKDPACRPGCECDRFVEFWNLVFTQFNKEPDGSLTPLRKKNIDTGMGLERLAAILQGKTNNFYTDLFQPLIKAASGYIGVDYDKETEIHFHIIADHIRALVFALSDGVIPSNDGRGYVIRRILRRALRQSRILGYKKPFLYRLAGDVASLYGEFYKGLVPASQHTQHLIQMEEERFLDTLDAGMAILEEECRLLKEKGDSLLSGETAFKLYDTYGFPADLTADILAEQGYTLDEKGFRDAMEGQRRRGRASWQGGSGEKRFLYVVEKGLPATSFTGYGKREEEGTLLHKEKTPEGWELVFDKSCLYGESGGQTGDQGWVIDGEKRFYIYDTQKTAGVHIHKIKEGGQILETGKAYRLQTDQTLRLKAARNHTATHLLHKALKEVLGSHVNQAGSYVGPDRLRFDFTHFSKMSTEGISAVEEAVNKAVMANKPVTVETMKQNEALEKGAVALFGEKYGHEVRVVSVEGISMELCGGTHVSRTGDIGAFVIVAEGSLAAGVRRIEAVTGEESLRIIRDNRLILEELSQLMKADRTALPERMEQMLKREKELQKEIEKMKMESASSDIDGIMAAKREEKGISLYTALLPAGDMKVLTETAQRIKDKAAAQAVIILAGIEGGKVNGVVMVSEDIKGRFKAGDIASRLAAQLGGGGGGRPDMARFGGKEYGCLEALLDRAGEYLL
ncbi:MAG TPA: alanine--tRNA ligase [Firmicutes bacterium]|nr:alanine--tRNA ligase [Bacillota bacterium]